VNYILRFYELSEFRLSAPVDKLLGWGDMTPFEFLQHV